MNGMNAILSILSKILLRVIASWRPCVFFSSCRHGIDALRHPENTLREVGWRVSVKNDRHSSDGRWRHRSRAEVRLGGGKDHRC